MCRLAVSRAQGPKVAGVFARGALFLSRTASDDRETLQGYSPYTPDLIRCCILKCIKGE